MKGYATFNPFFHTFLLYPGWPDEKSEQKLIAIELAEKSQFYKK
jgi:hypothetical protein